MLKAGFSRVDITPPLGTFVAGDFNPRYSKTVLDPLYLNALALEVDGEKVVIITCDILEIETAYISHIKAVISQRTGLVADNIMICSLHQHSSFCLVKNLLGLSDNNVVEDTSYLDVLYRKFGDVALMALDDLKEAKLSSKAQETAEQIAFIRRYYMKDGSIETNPIGRYLEVDRPYCKADNNVRLLKFEREGANDIALVNFSTHPDVIHKWVNSADWPGFARTYVEKSIKDVSCIVTVGFQGDTNHCDFTIPEYKDGYEHSKHMGRVIADTVVEMWDKTDICKADKLSAKVEIYYNKTRTDGEERYEEAKKILNDFQSGKNKDINYTILGEMTRIVDLKSAPIYHSIPLTVINIGRISFVGFGGEPFTRYGETIRKAFPDRFIITTCCTNGGGGYFPIKEAFEEVGYEAGSSPFSPSIEEESVNKAIQMIKELN